MKKIFILLLSFINIIFLNNINTIIKVSTNNIIYNLNEEESSFIIKNNIDYNNIKIYLKYDNFNINDYFKLEEARKDYNLTHLGALNFLKYPSYFDEYKITYPSPLKQTPLVLVNKCFYLDKSYSPNNLTPIKSYNVLYIDRKNETMMVENIVMDNYLLFFNEAVKNNIELIIYSAYRSYDKQSYLYYTVNKENNKVSAKPGFSEHQTGYSIDISDKSCGLTHHLEHSKTYKYIYENCYKYGFIIRYPKNKEEITKYSFEPWHLRYVGIPHSQIIYEKNLTLEEYIINYFSL